MRELRIVRKLCINDRIFINRYLIEIDKIPLISPEEEVELAVKIHSGDVEASKKLASANLRFVVSMAVQYLSSGLSLADLINEGNIGLMVAVEKFDETRGFKFISYAVQWIRQSIISAISEQTRVVRIPLNHHSNMWKIKTNTEKFLQINGIEPSITELSEELGITENVINDSISAYSSIHMSLDKSFNDGEDQNCLLDVLTNPNSTSPEKKLIHDSLKSEIDRMLLTLNSKEADVISMYYGIHCQAMTKNEIAERFGVKKTSIDKILSETRTKIKTSFRTNMLKTYSY